MGADYHFELGPMDDDSAGLYPWERVGFDQRESYAWETSFWEESYAFEMGVPAREVGYPFESEPQLETSGRPLRPMTPRFQSSSTKQRPPDPKCPLKVVYLGPTFRVGGVREHALSLARFLDPTRVRITEFVLTEPTESASEHHAQMPAPVAVGDQQTLERVSRECDVLLMWGTGFNDRLPSKRPVGVFLAHGESWWTRNALIENSRVIDHVIAVSEQVRRSICHGFPATTILNGVDTSRLGQTAARTEVRRRFAFAEGDFVVGSVGRLTREKQFHLLIEALARLPEQFKLLLVGSGRRQSELLDLANRRIPGRFVITSANDYLGNYYNAMDAFGLVSAHEGFGLVLAEAMMCGRPVFSTSVGCAREVFRDRVNGLLVQDHPDSVAQALAMLQEHPRWAAGLAREGQVFANRHLHAARMAGEYEDLLLQLHYQRHRRPRPEQ